MNALLAYSVGLALCGTCAAEQVASTPPADVKTASPTISSTLPNSIVDRDDATGLVRRPDTNPAEAAVNKLSLTPEQRRQVDIILRERAKSLDQFTRDNLKDLVRLHTAVQSGLSEATRSLLTELQSRSDLLKRLGRLPQELAPALNDQQKRELQRMVSQYWQERIREETVAAETRGDRLNLQAFMNSEQLFFVGIELKRSYERVFGGAMLDINSLLSNLKLTPAQAEHIREAAGAALEPEAAGRLSPAEKARAFFDVYARLTPDQREIVLAQLREGPTVAAAGRPVMPSIKPATADVPEDKK